jgi:hypothetical protein
VNLADLKREAEQLGLSVFQSGTRPAKEDYTSSLREYFLKRDYPNGPPYEEITPMLCHDFWLLHPKQQKMLWRNPDWVAQEKINGVRAILVFKQGLGVFCHSRTVSARSYRRVELTDRLPFASFKPGFDAIVDCEIAADKTNLQTTVSFLRAAARGQPLQLKPGKFLKFYVFDAIRWGGYDLRLRPLCERLMFLRDFQEAIVAAGLGQYFEILPTYLKDKEDVFERLVAAGAEGLVLKNLNYHYESSTSRSRFGWIKVKRQVEIDGYVSGFGRGKKGSEYENHVAYLEFSVLTDRGPVVIAHVSSLPWFYRKEVNVYDRNTDTVKLKMSEYGKVAHLVGMELSRKARRLTHARISYWRSDLKQEACTYQWSDLEATRLGVCGPILRSVAGGTG